MMYWYWKKRGIRPKFFQDLPSGELAIVRAFFELEIDEISKSEFICPMM